MRNYWKWLKNKLNAEGSEVVSATNQLNLIAPDGEMRLTNVVDTEQVFRIIQSILAAFKFLKLSDSEINDLKNQISNYYYRPFFEPVKS